MPSRVVIVGAGITGLAIAWHLKRSRPDLSVTVLEAASRAGGNIRSERIDGFLVEHGPNGFLDTKPSTIQLCKDLGLADKLISASEGARKNRYVFWNGRLQALPSSLGSFLGTPLLGWRSKYRLMTEKYRRSPMPDDESIEAFALRRTSREVADIFADAMVTGIHGGDFRRLSLSAAFPRLHTFEKEAGSVIGGMKRASRKRRKEAMARGEPPAKPGAMWSFRDGLQVMTDSLAAALGNSLRMNSGAKRIERMGAVWCVTDVRGESHEADHLVLSAPAYAQADLLGGVDDLLAAELRSIETVPIAVAAVGWNANPTSFPIDGFGFLVPQSLKRDILGVQWCTSIYEGRADAGKTLWRVLCGGAARPVMAAWPEDQLIDAVRKELKAMMGVVAPPDFVRIIRWPRAIPQYHIGHLARLSRIEIRLAALPGLHLAGNSFHGVGLNDCTEQAARLAGLVATRRSPRATPH